MGGWQNRHKEMNRPNVAMLRGRTLPMAGHEFVQTTVNPDGTFELKNLKAGPWFGPWFFVHEDLTGPPTIVGPVTITANDRTLNVDIKVLTEGGEIEGRCSERASGHGRPDPRHRLRRHDPPCATFSSLPMELSVWPTCPPADTASRWATDDAYIDPHACAGGGTETPLGRDRVPKTGRARGKAAVVVTVEPGKRAKGVVVDFRPPPPLVEPATKPTVKNAPRQ